MTELVTFSDRASFASNSYLIKSGGEYALIDPSFDFTEAQERVSELKDGLKYIILTHAHFDHFLDLDNWVRHTGAKVYVGHADAPMLKDARLNCYYQFLRLDKAYNGSCEMLLDGDTLTLGDTLLRIHSTPGHTAGSISIQCEDMLFVGDVIFDCGSYGRYDLPSADRAQLKNSIEKILTHSQSTQIFAGHGSSFTVREALKYNYL